jgi:hypothetical protein
LTQLSFCHQIFVNAAPTDQGMTVRFRCFFLCLACLFAFADLLSRRLADPCCRIIEQESPRTEVEHKQLQAIYRWIDKIPLSRPKRNIARDFADGGPLCCTISHA